MAAHARLAKSGNGRQTSHLNANTRSNFITVIFFVAGVLRIGNRISNKVGSIGEFDFGDNADILKRHKLELVSSSFKVDFDKSLHSS